MSVWPGARVNGSQAWAALPGLAAALASAAGGAGGEARRELLDVLAVAAGLKPVAVVGHAAVAPLPLQAVAAVAEAFGLATRTCAGWVGRGEFAGVPDWFREAAVAARSQAPLLALARGERALRMLPTAAGAALSAAAEAALLGYPECCTRSHAVWRARLHRALAACILAAAGDDPARARRMAAANWAPAPSGNRELAASLARRCAPGTAIVMCSRCDADPTSPARSIAAHYGALAAQLGFDGGASPGAADEPGRTPALAAAEVKQRLAPRTLGAMPL